MKKIIALVSLVLSICFAHAQQANIKQVLFSGNLIPSDSFKLYIVPHIPSKVAASAAKKDMTPETHVLPKAMNIKEIVATYGAPNAIELQDIPTIIANYGAGKFDNVPLLTGVWNVAVVVHRAPGKKDEEYFVIIAFTEGHWFIDAFKMDLAFKFGAGANYVTYK